MKQKQIKSLVIVIVAAILLLSAFFYFQKWQKSRIVSPNPSDRIAEATKNATLYQTDVEIESVNIPNKIISGKIYLVTDDFKKDPKTAIQNKNFITQKEADLKINDDTDLSDIFLDKLKAGDHIIVTTKENLFNYSGGELNLSSAKIR